MSSMLGLVGQCGRRIAYCASKAGILVLTIGSPKTNRKFGVRVQRDLSLEFSTPRMNESEIRITFLSYLATSFLIRNLIDLSALLIFGRRT